mgnify:FL=1
MDRTNRRVLAVRTSKTIYREGDTVIKVFDTDYSKADVLNEALNQARVEETGLNIPRLVEVIVEDGKWAIRSEYIEGVTLEKMMNDDPENADKYLEFFVDLQIQVHDKRAPLLAKLKDKMDRKICETDIDATIRYELHTALESMPKHKKLCHGDFNPTNIVMTPSGKPYILDWAHATQGNASADVGQTYLLFKLAGKDEFAEKYLDLFCEKTGTEKKYIQKWLPIVAAAQSVKGRAEERDLLLKWVNVVDYE